jgi:hypothetical protein
MNSSKNFVVFSCQSSEVDAEEGIFEDVFTPFSYVSSYELEGNIILVIDEKGYMYTAMPSEVEGKDAWVIQNPVLGITVPEFLGIHSKLYQMGYDLRWTFPNISYAKSIPGKNVFAFFCDVEKASNEGDDYVAQIYRTDMLDWVRHTTPISETGIQEAEERVLANIVDDLLAAIRTRRRP